MTIKGRRGTSSIELALTMPLMLTLLFGAVEYGWYHAHHGLLESAVSDACRGASLVNPRRADPVAVADERLATGVRAAGLSCTDPSVRCLDAVSGEAPMRRLTCSVRAPYRAVTGFVPVPETVVVTAVARLEYQP